MSPHEKVIFKQYSPVFKRNIMKTTNLSTSTSEMNMLDRARKEREKEKKNVRFSTHFAQNNKIVSCFFTAIKQSEASKKHTESERMSKKNCQFHFNSVISLKSVFFSSYHSLFAFKFYILSLYIFFCKHFLLF